MKTRTPILPGIVDKIIKPQFPGDLEKAQIVVEGADPLYKALRIENTLTDDQGRPVELNPARKWK